MRRLFRWFRILVLLTILILVAGGSLLTSLRTTDWDNTLWVAVYPINADGNTEVDTYIQKLDVSTFASIEAFFADEAKRWDVEIAKPVTVFLAPVVTEVPPIPPIEGNTLEIMWWSLHFRYWAWKVDTFEGPSPDIRIFVSYHTPVADQVLAHSVGLEQGLLGIANVFADRRHARSNNVIIAHEILHTLGATDKYDARGLPIYPLGYAEPDRSPRHPQTFAEIMAGRIPKSIAKAIIPRSLQYCIVGRTTAREINWTEE